MKTNDQLIRDFQYGTYQNDLVKGIAVRSVKIHLRKQIELLQQVIDMDRTSIINLMGNLELQRSEL